MTNKKLFPLKNYVGLYSITKNGDIYSHDGKSGGHGGKFLKPDIASGYKQVTLFKNNLKKRYKIHRLVAMNFIKNTENKSQVNHKNGIKTDNRVENLEWCTKSENVSHAYKIGLNESCRKAIALNGKKQGPINAKAQRKLSWGDVVKIRKLYDKKIYTNVYIGNLFKISHQLVWSIGKRFTYLNA